MVDFIVRLFEPFLRRLLLAGDDPWPSSTVLRRARRLAGYGVGAGPRVICGVEVA
ncbi:hypothetical protein ACFWNG_16630 [Streptomyces sp. NPDC058391]|uniref:hypothetical protein n=1 Tax=Streptomyces sp. NPDC058391 TaxID=3346476 RepID=UPI0036469B27